MSHQINEEKPCSRCRLQLVLAGVNPAALDGIKTTDEAKSILAEHLEKDANDPEFRAKQRGATVVVTFSCHDICRTHPDRVGIKARYDSGYWCVSCRARFQSGLRCPCCKAMMRRRGRMSGRQERASITECRRVE